MRKASGPSVEKVGYVAWSPKYPDKCIIRDDLTNYQPRIGLSGFCNPSVANRDRQNFQLWSEYKAAIEHDYRAMAAPDAEVVLHELYELRGKRFVRPNVSVDFKDYQQLSQASGFPVASRMVGYGVSDKERHQSYLIADRSSSELVVAGRPPFEQKVTDFVKRTAAKGSVSAR